MPLSLSEDELATFNRLENLLMMSRSDTSRLNQYYEGDRLIKQLGLAIPPELQQFSVFLAWPRISVDGCEQRLDVTGFRMPGQVADQSLWGVWQYNDLDQGQSEAHTDALALGRSYICVGTNPEDREYPLVTVESPMEMVTLRDPATRRVTAALRMYSVGPENGATAGKKDTRATLYLPNVTYWLQQDGLWQDAADPDRHNLGVVPVVPMVNRDRPTRKTGAFIEGISEMADVIPIAESASRAITNAQLAQETHAVPHRVLLGASKKDFVDQDGQPTGAFDLYFSSVTALQNPAAKAMQFDGSDLANFERMVNVYARLASGVTSMPIEYFGLNTENAPSAEGQRAGETRLIKKAERKQVAFGHAWEQAMRLVRRFQVSGVADPDPQVSGVADPDPQVRGLETQWRDAGTPTRAQVADATVKLFSAGLIDWETAQEDLGRSPAQIQEMKTRRQADRQLDVFDGVQDAIVENV